MATLETESRGEPSRGAVTVIRVAAEKAVKDGLERRTMLCERAPLNFPDAAGHSERRKDEADIDRAAHRDP